MQGILKTIQLFWIEGLACYSKQVAMFVWYSVKQNEISNCLVIFLHKDISKERKYQREMEKTKMSFLGINLKIVQVILWGCIFGELLQWHFFSV